MVDPSNHEDLDARVAKLLLKRIRRYAELQEIYGDFKTWGIGIGRLRIQARVGTNTIALVFLLWHILAGIAGVTITIIWKDNKELGVALIVGSLFGVGSFMSQFWSQAMDYQREFIDRVLHEDDVNRLRDTLDDLVKIDRELSKRLRHERDDKM
jgi:ribosomal protein S13